MRNYMSSIAIVALLGVMGIAVQAQETVYPAGTNVTIRYSSNRTALTTADTLILTRTLVNKTSYSITGLYFSDNFASQYRVVSQVITVNGVSAAATLTGPDYGQVTSGYNNYRWIIDSPIPGENRHRTIAVGDSVSLVVKIVCSVAGTYSLPLHATVGYSNGSGLFAQANAATITFTSATDTTPPAPIFDLGDIETYEAFGPIKRETTVWKLEFENQVTVG